MTRSAGSLFACLLSCLGAPAPAVTPVAIAPAPPIVPAATTTTRSTWPNLYTVSGPRADLLLTRLRFDDHGASCDPSGVCTAVGYGTAEDAADAARDPKLEVKLFRTGQQQEDRARAEINSRGHTPCDLEEAAWNQTLASGGTCRQDADCAVIPEEPYNIVTACNHATDLATLAKLAGILERKACSTALCAPIAVRCRTGRCARTP